PRSHRHTLCRHSFPFRAYGLRPFPFRVETYTVSCTYRVRVGTHWQGGGLLCRLVVCLSLCLGTAFLPLPLLVRISRSVLGASYPRYAFQGALAASCD